MLEFVLIESLLIGNVFQEISELHRFSQVKNWLWIQYPFWHCAHIHGMYSFITHMTELLSQTTGSPYTQHRERWWTVDDSCTQYTSSTTGSDDQTHWHNVHTWSNVWYILVLPTTKIKNCNMINSKYNLTIMTLSMQLYRMYCYLYMNYIIQLHGRQQDLLHIGGKIVYLLLRWPRLL